MATEQGPFGYQFLNDASSSHIKQSAVANPPLRVTASSPYYLSPKAGDSRLGQASRPLNDSKNLNNLQDNLPGSNNSAQSYATPTWPSPCDKFTHVDPRFTNLKNPDEDRMISAQKLWEEVDCTLSKYMPEKSLAIFAAYSNGGSKLVPTKQAEQFRKASESIAGRRPAMNWEMAVPTGSDQNNKKKRSLTLQVPRCQDPFLNDMAFQQEIENFFADHGISKRQARYERGDTPVFKDSGVYMEDNFQWEASKKSPIGSDLMDEAYDEGTLSHSHDDLDLNGLMSSDEHHGHVQPVSENKRSLRSPVPEHVLRDLTSDEQTVQSSLAVFDEANKTYIRGGTPPYDLFDLHYRCKGFTPIWVNLNANLDWTASRMTDKARATMDNDLSTNHHTQAGNEGTIRPASSGPASSQSVKIIESDKEDSNRSAPDIMASPSASLVGLTGGDRWLSPPTPRWPNSQVSMDREQSPPTPRWPHSQISVDREQSPANPQWSRPPPNYNIEFQHGISSLGLPIEGIISQVPKASSVILPGLNRAANAGNSNGNIYLGADSATPWAEQQEPLNFPAVSTYQAPSSPTPVPPKRSAIPDRYQFLEETNDSSTDSDADGDPSLPVYPKAMYGSSPPIPRQQLPSSSAVEAAHHRDPTKWINIAPPAHARSSSPMTDSSGFFDNGVTASFCAPPLISPTIREIKDISPTGITQMRLSRQRARETEERATRAASVMQPNLDLEEGRKLERPSFNYPEHPSFHDRDVNAQKALDAETPSQTLPGDHSDVSKVHSMDMWNQNIPPQDRSVQVIIEQSIAPPHLRRQSSGFDSLDLFPPTPTDTIPPPLPLSSAPSAVPNPYFIAAQRALASSVQRPSTPPAPENAPRMPGYPRFSPSPSALELTLPNEVAGTPTPARRGPGRPKKGNDGKEPKKPATKRPRKSVASQRVLPENQENISEGDGAITLEQARPAARKAPVNSTEAYDETPADQVEETEQHGGKSAFDEWKKATARKAPRKTKTTHQTPESKETETELEQSASAMNETKKATARKAPRKTNPTPDEKTPADDEGEDELATPLPTKSTARKAPRKRKGDREVQGGEDELAAPVPTKTTARKAPRKRTVTHQVQAGEEAVPAAKKQRR